MAIFQYVNINISADLSQVGINDVFDDITNQVESQMGGSKPTPIRQLDKPTHRTRKFRRKRR